MSTENTAIADLLRRFSHGEGSIVRNDPVSAQIEVDGWLIALFIDAGELDYVEAVMRPDGSTADYGELAEDDATDAVDLLTSAEVTAIEQRLG